MARQTLRDLVRDGALPVGTELIHPGRQHPDQRAVVVGDGIEFQGKVYDSPSGAARAATGTTAENGWRFWRLRDSGQLLGDLRTPEK